MSCREAVITDVLKATPFQTVGEVMGIFEVHCFNGIPVVDNEGRLVGLFSMKSVLNHLLPVSAQIEGGLRHLDFISDSEEGVAKKLHKLRRKTIGEVMEKNPPFVYLDTSGWEVVKIMSESGSPLPVLEKETLKLVGIISMQSLLLMLQNILRRIDGSEENFES